MLEIKNIDPITKQRVVRPAAGQCADAAFFATIYSHRKLHHSTRTPYFRSPISIKFKRI